MEQDRFGSTVQSGSREINEGLRKHMNSIYMKMSGGVLVTALVAMIVGSSPALFLSLIHI